MSIRNSMHLSTVVVVLAGGASLVAQVTTGSLSGHVVSATGEPLAGARVSLESPALFQPRVLKTDEKGEYRAPLLPVGNYTIHVTLAGMLGRTAEGVRIGVGSTRNFDFMLKAVNVAGATVEVMGTGAQESKTDDKVSVNYSAEDLLKLPTGRSFDGALAISPGVTGSGLDTNIRGGSSSGQTHNGNVGYSQMLYRVDGIDVKDDTGGQWDAPSRATLYDPLPDSIEDVQVVQSALNARNGRTSGGQVNVVTKSGSNTFEGTVRAYINRPSWTTNLARGPVDGDLSQSETHAVEGYSRFVDATFSGPILKDKLWFFVGTRLQPNDSGTARLGWGSPAVMQQQQFDDAGHPTGWSDLPGDWKQYMNHPLTTWGQYPSVDAVLINRTGAPTSYQNPDLSTSDIGAIVPADTQYSRYQARLTGQVTANNTLSLTYLYSKETAGGYTGERSGPSTAINKDFMGDIVTKTNAWALNWTSTLNDKWSLEAKYSKAEVKIDDVAGPQTYPYFVQSTLGTGDANTMLYAQDDGQNLAYSNNGGRAGYFGVFYTLRSSSSVTPNVRGNESVSANLKTYQDIAGQKHEIDIGGESFQTEHQFGRERKGNFGVFEGGWIKDPSKSYGEASAFLFPVFYTQNDTPLVPVDGSGNAFPEQVQGQELMRGPSAHIEQYNVKGAKAKNNSTSLWVNDTWTVNDFWNVMVGLRWNKFMVKDTGGEDRANNSIVEPRFQLKYNPDGKGAEVYTFTAAKLASSYSDDMASWFRTNGWTTRVVRAWDGHGSFPTQPAVDSPSAATDTVDGVNMHGVRWVTYEQLTDLNNYRVAPQKIVALDQLMRTDGLQVPYAMEFTLNYLRNFDTGNFRISLVDRTYKKDWVIFVHPGLYDANNPSKYLTLVNDPNGSDVKQWQQTHYFINSEKNRNYQSVELSWNDNLTPRLVFGGNYTYSVEHGLTNNGLDYYNYREEKLKLAIPEREWAPTNALLNRAQVARLWLTYTLPVGKGNVSASMLGEYYTTGLRNLAASRSLGVTYPSGQRLNAQGQPVTTGGYEVIAQDPGSYQNTVANFNIYYGGVGAFTNGADVYNVNLKLQAQFPLFGRTMLTTYVQIDNLFNRVLQSHVYDWGYGDLDSDGVQSSPIPGRALSYFHKPWGTAGDNSYINNAGRTFTQFSIGLKF